MRNTWHVKYGGFDDAFCPPVYNPGGGEAHLLSKVYLADDHDRDDDGEDGGPKQACGFLESSGK